jgi:predicted NodU family carbamoyl transferase
MVELPAGGKVVALFQGRGEPIVETPAEAVECFKARALDALAMPPYIIRKRSAVSGRPVMPTTSESVTASER